MTELEQQLADELGKPAGQYAEAQKQYGEWANRTTALAEDHQKMGAHVTKLTDAYDALLNSYNDLIDTYNALGRDLTEPIYERRSNNRPGSAA